MISDTEAYRILGLARGATTDEVKRAYRRLAKIHHPDAAGEKNLPHFLAIQAAYEQLTDGLDGPARGRRAGSAAAPRRPWDADPDRSDATRRAYGGRTRGTKSAGSGAGRTTGDAAGPATPRGTGAPGRAGPTGRPSSRPTGRSGSTSPGAGRRPGPEPGPPPPPGAGASASGAGEPSAEQKTRKRNKATFGSTSYDNVDGPFEPDWRGASWYGTTSGTYWTLNPKEYADPRKHGPEYQARARRATRNRPTGDTPGEPAAPEAGEAPVGADPTGAAPHDPVPEPGVGATHTTSSWWESTAGPVDPDPDVGAAWTGPGPRPGPAPWPVGADAVTDTPPPDIGRALADIGRALTDDGFGGIRGRVVRGIIGWLPIAFGIGWLVGEMTGCGRFAATCDNTADPFVLALQAAVLAILLFVPAAGSVAAMGAIALLVAAVGATLILSATGGAADGDSRRATLGAILLVAWLVGLAIAVVRRIRALSSPTTPVS